MVFYHPYSDLHVLFLSLLHPIEMPSNYLAPGITNVCIGPTTNFLP
jgi:hypothetical protein